MKPRNPLKDSLFGAAVGDALGVPAEFEPRLWRKRHPVTGMTGYGTHGQPPGTWSDDSSLTFCLAEALTGELDLNTIATNFKKWLFDHYWTARGEVFDVGNATFDAIHRLAAGMPPERAGSAGEHSNGNGSLMRILPLAFYLMDKPVDERFAIIRNVSSITHRHIRSVIACFYYLEFARRLLEGKDKFFIYKELQVAVSEFLHSISIDPEEIATFDRLLKGKIYELPENQIKSSGYVVDTLEAGIWCLLTTDNYRDAVLRAVNLGEDTDTTGTVTGGLAGLLYGYERIPAEWIEQLARKEDIEDLASRIAAAGIVK